MKLTCMGCGTDSEGDTCPICHKYDTEDYVIDDSKPPRVVALEKELAEAVGRYDYWRKRCKQAEEAAFEYCKRANAAESLLLTIQAWDINKEALRGHQCLAKQWIYSFQDRLNRYKRGKK